jgi:peroxiredoxin
MSVLLNRRQKVKRRKIVAQLLFLSILIGLISIIIQGCSIVKNPMKSGNWTLPVVYNSENNGFSNQVEMMKLLKQPQTKLVLLDFWATWDKPENIEVSYLEDIFQNNKEKGLMVLGVSLDPAEMPKERILDYMNNVTYPLLWDKDGILKEKYSISTIPTHLLIDKNNKIVFQNSSLTKEGLDALSNKIKNLLP